MHKANTAYYLRTQRNREMKEVDLFVVRHQIPSDLFLEAFFFWFSLTFQICQRNNIDLMHCQGIKSDMEVTS